MAAAESDKIKTLSELQNILRPRQKEGAVVVHCHGVFDLIHPGHIRHFKEAKRQGNILVVTATADRYVNKGVGRPVFNQTIRLETLAAIECVDFVALNDNPDAIVPITTIRPNVYVKGIEYKDHNRDITGKIAQEVAAVESCGGHVHYTDDIVFSSTELLNTHFGKIPEQVKDYIQTLKSKYSTDDIIAQINKLSSLRVLVVGDAIIDDYQYVDPLGQSGKGLHMVARCKEEEVFAGGVFAVANHVANYSQNVTLLTAIGDNDGTEELLESRLNPNIKREFVVQKDARTLNKKRYVLRDGDTLSKLFETYSGADNLINHHDAAKVCSFIKERGHEFDLILVSDFGNGFVNRDIIESLTASRTMLAVNAQINSGNRGYNVVTHYPRADYISLNEPELRLTAHDKHGELRLLVAKVCDAMKCSNMTVTRGVKGALVYNREYGFVEIPALTTHAIDRVGAGDSYLSVSSVCLAGGISFELAAFVGSVAAAIDVQIVGNKESVDKVGLCKYITTLMKS